jgi:hypothetical protein
MPSSFVLVSSVKAEAIIPDKSGGSSKYPMRRLRLQFGASRAKGIEQSPSR